MNKTNSNKPYLRSTTPKYPITKTIRKLLNTNLLSIKLKYKTKKTKIK